MYSVLHLSSKVCLGTFSLMFWHSCLVAGLHFLPEMLEQFSSSSYLVMVAGTLRQTSSGISLQTSRGVWTSLQTCLGTWLHCLLVTVEHLRSETSLVWILGTREQTRLDFFWQSLTGTSWQDWRLSSWQSTFCTSMHLCFGTLEHSWRGNWRH